MDKKGIEKKYIGPGEIYELVYNIWPLYNACDFCFTQLFHVFLGIDTGDRIFINHYCRIFFVGCFINKQIIITSWNMINGGKSFVAEK